jgi:hypothetical protein
MIIIQILLLIPLRTRKSIKSNLFESQVHQSVIGQAE